ncbi:MAG: preprotein translocase subunit SecG [Pseudomonadota bacterium]
MDAIFSIIQVLIAIAMIAIILIQRGPGAAAGSGFGAGASGTVFGARGSGSFLTRTTGLLAIAFFAVSMTMAVLASRVASTSAGPDLGVMGEIEQSTPEVPALDVPTLEVPEVSAPSSADDVPVVPAPEAAGEEGAGGTAVEAAQPERQAEGEETPEP